MSKRLVVCANRPELVTLRNASINGDDVFVVLGDRLLGQRFSDVVFTTKAQELIDRANATLAWHEMAWMRIETEQEKEEFELCDSPKCTMCNVVRSLKDAGSQL